MWVLLNSRESFVLWRIRKSFNKRPLADAVDVECEVFTCREAGTGSESGTRHLYIREVESISLRSARKIGTWGFCALHDEVEAMLAGIKWCEHESYSEEKENPTAWPFNAQLADNVARAQP